MKELISIIVPAYNSELFLHRCINSILSQTYDNLEIILVDDGSTDSTLEIFRTYEIKDSRIKVVHKENGGQSTARNAGLNIARGEFIGFVDSDDYIRPTMYENLYKSINSSDYDMAICGIEMNNNGIIRNLLGHENNLIIKGTENIVDKFIDGYMGFGPVNKLFRRRIFEEIRFREGIIFEDFELLSRLIFKMNKVKIVSSIEYVYVVNSESTTKSKFSIQKMNLIDVTTQVFEVISNKYPKLEEKAFKLMIIDHFTIINWITKDNCVKKYIDEYNYIKSVLFKNLRKILSNKYISVYYKVLTIFCIYCPWFYRILIKLKKNLLDII